MFQELDENGDGKLSKEEVLNGYEKVFGVTINEEEVDKMFAEIDIDGNGTIDYTEFVMATMNEKNILSNDRLEQAFKMFDKVCLSFNKALLPARINLALLSLILRAFVRCLK